MGANAFDVAVKWLALGSDKARTTHAAGSGFVASRFYMFRGRLVVCRAVYLDHLPDGFGAHSFDYSLDYTRTESSGGAPMLPDGNAPTPPVVHFSTGKETLCQNLPAADLWTENGGKVTCPACLVLLRRSAGADSR